MTKKHRYKDINVLRSHRPEDIKILIGMSGKVSSTIAAFLLKKQGFQVAGVGISLWNSEMLKSTWKGFDRYCSAYDLDAVKRICEELEMPFYAVNAQSEYFDKIIDPMISRSISGETAIPCTFCQELKLRILESKLEVLKADFIATGHYAKIHKNQKSHAFHVYSGADHENDQSKLLAGVPESILSRLVLPLSDLRKIEVSKLAERFSFETLADTKGNDMCYVKDKAFPDFIESRVSEKFLEVGNFYNAESEYNYGEHLGIHHYQLGQDQLGNDKSSPLLDKRFKVLRINSGNKDIFIGEAKDVAVGGAYIHDIRFNGPVDRSKPLTSFMKTVSLPSKLNSKIFFKNNNTAYVDFEAGVDFLNVGEEIVFYDRDGSPSRIICSGRVLSLGKYDRMDRLEGVRDQLEFDDDEDVKIEVKEIKF